MNKIATFLTLVSALFVSQPTSAQVPNGKLAGAVQLYTNLHAMCAIEIEINNSLSAMKLTSCASAILPLDTSIGVTYIGNTVTFHDIELYSMVGYCAGDLSAEWDGTRLIFNTTLPSQGTHPDCQIVGMASKLD